MDLETENRIASILLKEAAELRRQADGQGVHVYLQQPKVRGRPNSRFLTATVLGVQQANRAVEVNEMWRVRQKELELDDRLEGRSKNDGRHSDFSASCTSSKRMAETSYSLEDGGLRDEEIKHGLAKRGRGSIGSRMDETGPYLPTNSDSPEMVSTNAGESSSDEELREHRWKKEKAHSKSSDKKHRQKHKTKENPTDKRKKREKKSRHGE